MGMRMTSTGGASVRCRLGLVLGATVVALLVPACSEQAASTKTAERSLQRGEESLAPAGHRSTAPLPSSAVTRSQVSLATEFHAATSNFYRVVNKSYRTLDTRPVADLLAPGSDAASGYTTYVEKVKSAGHHFESLAEYQIKHFRVSREDPGGGVHRVKFTLSIDGGREVDGNGRTVELYGPQSWRHAWITFTEIDGRWFVVGQAVDEVDH